MAQYLSSVINSMLNNYIYTQDESQVGLINELLERQHNNRVEDNELDNIQLPPESSPPAPVDDSSSDDSSSYDSSSDDSSSDESISDDSDAEFVQQNTRRIVRLYKNDADLSKALANEMQIGSDEILKITKSHLDENIFNIYFKSLSTTVNRNNKVCKCGSNFHLTRKSKDCPINKSNIMRIFNILNIKFTYWNVASFVYDIRNHSSNESFNTIKIIISKTNYSTKVINNDEVSILKEKILKLENERKYLIKNELIVENAECGICCETVPIDNLYKSECDCKYKYCKPCHQKLPKVYNNQHKLVTRCPTCRSVAL